MVNAIDLKIIRRCCNFEKYFSIVHFLFAAIAKNTLKPLNIVLKNLWCQRESKRGSLGIADHWAVTLKRALKIITVAGNINSAFYVVSFLPTITDDAMKYHCALILYHKGKWGIITKVIHERSRQFFAWLYIKVYPSLYCN